VGRPQATVSSVGPLADLARWLRSRQECAGVTYRTMAESTGVPASRLSRAANGKTMPQWETVRAYVRACGGDGIAFEIAEKRWRMAQQSHSERTLSSSRPYVRVAYCDPSQVRTPEGLAKALRYLRLQAGQPSLADLAARARVNGDILYPSTVSDLLRGRTRRPGLGTVLALAKACGDCDRLHAWQLAWHRARLTRTERAAEAKSARRARERRLRRLRRTARGGGTR
jgi:transcriptional regulator with XRE-family HTH domain